MNNSIVPISGFDRQTLKNKTAIASERVWVQRVELLLASITETVNQGKTRFTFKRKSLYPITLDQVRQLLPDLDIIETNVDSFLTAKDPDGNYVSESVVTISWEAV